MTVRVHADIQALQLPGSMGRGIGRYVFEHARALEVAHPGVVEAWVARPEYVVGQDLGELLPTGRVRLRDDDLPPPDVWHVMSPFENFGAPSPLEEVWPSAVRRNGTRLVVTLYDLIPLIYPEHYLRSAASLRAYAARAQLIERADHVLAISQATADDAMRVLGVPASRLTVIGSGVSDHFVPPPDRTAAVALACGLVPGMRPGYVLYTGGIDFRKNIDGLVTAYSRLPREVRAHHQLVIVCRVTASEREHLTQRAAAMGIEDDLLITGFVSDETLLRVYQGAHLFIFPSLYEGFGLPVVEAMSCGVPTIVGRNSSLTEIVKHPRAWFDAGVVDDITRAMFRALTDDELLAELGRDVLDHDHRWALVAARTVEAYESLHSRRRTRRPHWAFVSPMPPAASGVADYSMGVLRALTEHVDVDVFTSADADRPVLPGVRWFDYGDFDAVRRAFGRHDETVVAMGNSDHHMECLRVVREVPGVTVMAHDVRYTGMLSVARELTPGLVDDDVPDLLTALHTQRLPEHRAEYGHLDPTEYFRYNDLLTGHAVGAAARVHVHSRTALALARMNVPAAVRERIDLLPFAVTPRPALPLEHRDVVASFGIVDRTKRSDVVVDAFLELAPRHPDTVFAVVGGAADTKLMADLHARVLERRLADRVVLTGRVDAAQYDGWLARTRVAVQLRAHSNGESSAAVADCLGVGAATVVSEVGAMAELGDVCRAVPTTLGPVGLVEVLDGLLADDEEIGRLSAAGIEYARSHSFADVARALVERAGRVDHTAV